MDRKSKVSSIYVNYIFGLVKFPLSLGTGLDLLSKVLLLMLTDLQLNFQLKF